MAHGPNGQINLQDERARLGLSLGGVSLGVATQGVATQGVATQGVATQGVASYLLATFDAHDKALHDLL